MSELHLAFHRSTAGALTQALATQSVADPVIGFIDDLSFGPIGVAQEARAEWVGEVVGCRHGERSVAIQRFR